MEFRLALPPSTRRNHKLASCITQGYLDGRHLQKCRFLLPPILPKETTSWPPILVRNSSVDLPLEIQVDTTLPIRTNHKLDSYCARDSSVETSPRPQVGTTPLNKNTSWPFKSLKEPSVVASPGIQVGASLPTKETTSWPLVSLRDSSVKASPGIQVSAIPPKGTTCLPPISVREPTVDLSPGIQVGATRPTRRNYKLASYHSWTLVWIHFQDLWLALPPQTNHKLASYSVTLVWRHLQDVRLVQLSPALILYSLRQTHQGQRFV